MRGQRLADHDQQHDDDVPGSELAVRGPAAVAGSTGAAVAVRNSAGRQAARRVPFFACAATGATGTTSWWLVKQAAASGHSALAGRLVLGICAASVVALVILRIRYRDQVVDDVLIQRIPERHRWRWWLAGVLAVAWIAAMALGAVDRIGGWAMAAALLVGAALMSLRWAREHPVRPRVIAPPPPPAVLPPPLPAPVPALPVVPPPPVDPRHPLHRRWDERVAAGEKVVLKGAELIPLDLLPQAAKWKIDTDGDFTFDEIAACQRKIAARLGILARNVIIERDGEEEGSALLTIVLIDTILTADLTYPGPQYLDGRIPVAMAADGTGWLYHVADDPDTGCQSGMIVGEPGAGKTAAMETIVAGHKVSGVWDILYADGDPGGGSSPVLNKIANRAFAGPMGALRVLEALEAAIEYRSRLKPYLVIDTRTGLVERLPTKGAPVPHGMEPVRDMHATHQFHGVLGVIDEFKRHLGDERLQNVNFAERVENVEMIGRKYGVRLLIGTQSLLAGHWGLRTNLRAWLAAMNAWIMRSQNQSEGNALNGVAGAASSLPKQPGSCYSAGSQRMVLARVAWEKGLDRYAPQFPTTPGDRGTAMAITNALDDPRHRAGVDDLDAAGGPSLEEIEAALATGKNPFIEDEPTPPAQPAARPAQQAPASAGQPAGPRRFTTPSGATLPGPLTGATVTQLHPRPATPAVPPPAPTANSERALAYLRAEGPTTTGDLAKALGWSTSTASKALGLLRERGEAHLPTGKTGTYAATPVRSAGVS